MALSVETAQRIANTFRVEFNMRIDPEKEGSVWREVLQSAGLTDENAEGPRGAYRRFAESWTTTSQKPSLNIFARWVRLHMQEPKKVYYRPPGERCGLCKDEGEIPALLATDMRGHLTPATAVCEINEPYSDGLLYRRPLPCKCTRGQKRAEQEGLSDKWRDYRDQLIKWFTQNSDTGPIVLIHRWHRQCYQAYDRSVQAGLAEAVVGTDEDLDEAEDVADDEIPF